MDVFGLYIGRYEVVFVGVLITLNLKGSSTRFSAVLGIMRSQESSTLILSNVWLRLW